MAQVWEPPAETKAQLEGTPLVVATGVGTVA